jgi:CHASE2 domain-containing sensor protein/tRNA A-37 threonylcarbamoyl transferase component Bud32
VLAVAVDEASQKSLGAWPLPAAVHAKFIDTLRLAGAGVIAFTAPLNPERNQSESDGDAERIQAALKLLDSPGLSQRAESRKLRELLDTSADDRAQHRQLARAIEDHGGVIQATPEQLTPLPDADGVNRRQFAFTKNGTELVPSVGIAALARYFNLDPRQLQPTPRSRIQLGRHQPRLGSQLDIRPQFFPLRGPRAIPVVSYVDVLAGKVPAASLRGKIVLVGPTTERAAGSPTPLGEAAPALLQTGAAVSSILQDELYTRPALSIVIEWAARLAVIFLAAFALPKLGAALGAGITIAFVTALVVLELGLLSSFTVWVQLLSMCLAAIAALVAYMALQQWVRVQNAATPAPDPVENLKMLGLTFQNQGQLDLAFETFRRCPPSEPVMDMLYSLGLDFERRRQFQKAGAVYSYMSGYHGDFRDLQRRLKYVNDADVSLHTAPAIASKPVSPLPEPEAEAGGGKGSLGRYQIERTLGKGAMGTVYLGKDPKINRVVAIKAIPLAEEFEEDDLAEAKARFFREAEMAGRLNHPGIVIVYDAGEQQGLAYIAMEYLRGQHLSHYTEPGNLLPVRTVLLLIARVADALNYAHRQNVIHRDIKPANIMFDPEADELKITDFGIARLTDTSRTKTGIVLGTPSFMSPEQLEGRSIDGRSDLFALGVSLFYLLTGQLPFRADSMTRLMHKIASEPHPPIHVLRPDVPVQVEEILKNALAKSPEDRYQSGAEFAAALRTCAQAAVP